MATWIVAKNIFLAEQFRHGHGLTPGGPNVISPESFRGADLSGEDTIIWLVPPTQGLALAVELFTLDPDDPPLQVHRYQAPLTFRKDA